MKTQAENEAVVAHALLAALLPTLSMTIVSWVVGWVKTDTVSNDFESFSGAFCGGMILAAVASELFPMLEGSSFLGLTIGFGLGMAMITALSAQDALFKAAEDANANAPSSTDFVGYNYQSLDETKNGGGGGGGLGSDSDGSTRSSGSMDSMDSRGAGIERSSSSSWVVALDTLEAQATTIGSNIAGELRGGYYSIYSGVLFSMKSLLLFIAI